MHGVLSNVSSFTLAEFVCIFSTVSFQMYFQTVCTRGCMVTVAAFVWLFLHCVFSNASSICLHWQMYLVALVALVCFFSTVGFQMVPQITCLRGCIITLVAFVWLFSTVGFQMSPQITCIRCSKVTSVVSNRSHGRMQNRIGCICLAWCHSLPLLNELLKWLKIMLNERQWKLCCTSLKSWVELKTKWRLQINFQRSD